MQGREFVHHEPTLSYLEIVFSDRVASDNNWCSPHTQHCIKVLVTKTPNKGPLNLDIYRTNSVSQEVFLLELFETSQDQAHPGS